MSKLILSQSLLKDFHKMCGEALRVKWFVHYEKEEDNPFYIGDKEVVQLGNIYEQNVIGISRGGKTTTPTPELAKKPVFDRMKEQAATTKIWYRNLRQEGKVLAVQRRIEASFVFNGVTVWLDGNLDIEFIYNSGKRGTKDLKLSSDRDASFGEFQWKNLDKINYSQAKQYTLLLHLHYNTPLSEIDFEYHIADTSTKRRVKIINVIISESTMEGYKEELYNVYTQLIESLEIGYFPLKNEYDICSECPIKESCEFRNTIPTVQYVEL